MNEPVPAFRGFQCPRIGNELQTDRPTRRTRSCPHHLPTARTARMARIRNQGEKERHCLLPPGEETLRGVIPIPLPPSTSPERHDEDIFTISSLPMHPPPSLILRTTQTPGRVQTSSHHPELGLHRAVEVADLGGEGAVWKEQGGRKAVSSALTWYRVRGRSVPVRTSEVSMVSSLPRRMSRWTLERAVKPVLNETVDGC